MEESVKYDIDIDMEMEIRRIILEEMIPGLIRWEAENVLVSALLRDDQGFLPGVVAPAHLSTAAIFDLAKNKVRDLEFGKEKLSFYAMFYGEEHKVEIPLLNIGKVVAIKEGIVSEHPFKIFLFAKEEKKPVLTLVK